MPLANKSSCLFLAFLVAVSWTLAEPFSTSQEAENGFSAYLPVRNWIGPDGTPIEFEGDEEILEFLRSAEIKEIKKLPEGSTKPRKILLEKNRIQMYAIFRDVDEFRKKWRSSEGIKRNYYDSAISECAAYRLSCMLGLDNIPPVVRRTVKGTKGTIQAWVEASMNEKERKEKDVMPPDRQRWSNQFQIMYVFDTLIRNDDRNQGNILFGPDWKVWFIDSTRAFQTEDSLKNANLIRKCSRILWGRLNNLTDEEIKANLEDYLDGMQIKTLLKRRELLVNHIANLIEVGGEESVLFDLSD